MTVPPLQNDAGYAKWGPDAERVKKLVNAFRPKPRERHNSSGELMVKTESNLVPDIPEMTQSENAW